MLKSKNLDDKTYEQYIEEAIAQIPLYSSEWTNYNPSDPGITMLENLSAFSALQQSIINTVSDEVRWQLLKLAGFTPKQGTPAHVFLRRHQGKKWKRISLPGEKIYAQELCFEFVKESGMTDVNLTAVYGRRDGSVQDLSELLEEYGVTEGVEIFGCCPSGGEELHFCFDELPQENEVLFSVEVKKEFVRNPFQEDGENPFAQTEWFLLTEDGEAALSVEDGTWQFLTDGVIRVILPMEREKICRNSQGMYEILVRIKSCAYDFPPMVTAIRGMLSEAEQKDTISAVCFYRTALDTLNISHELLRRGLLTLYERQGEGYRRMEQGEYSAKKEDNTSLTLTFTLGNKERELLAVILDESVLAYQKLGQIYGFDNQEIMLPPNLHVYAREFSLLAKRGEKYFLVNPEEEDEQLFLYRVEEEKGQIVILDCRDFEGAEIFLGNCVSYAGENGNIIQGTLLETESGKKEYGAISCMSAVEGRYTESLEQVQRRFAEDVRTSATIVTREDCEKIVRKIPGLAIHKVRAKVDAEKNEIQVTIKPYSREPYPRLSNIYSRMVAQYLSERRLLSSRIEIHQPQYVPIRVHAVLHIRKNFANGLELVREALNKEIDGNGQERNFGEVLYFHEIYQAVSKLECVEEIISLTIAPQRAEDAVMKGFDIYLKQDALSYPGEYQLETIR